MTLTSRGVSALDDHCWVRPALAGVAEEEKEEGKVECTHALLTALRAGPPFSWGVTSGGPPGGRSLSKDGTRADSAKDFCRLVGGVYYAGNLISG